MTTTCSVEKIKGTRSGKEGGKVGLSLSIANELPGDADTASHSSRCAEQHGNPGRVNALSDQLEKSWHAILEPRETSVEASGHEWCPHPSHHCPAPP